MKPHIWQKGDRFRIDNNDAPEDIWQVDMVGPDTVAYFNRGSDIIVVHKKDISPVYRTMFLIDLTGESKNYKLEDHPISGLQAWQLQVDRMLKPVHGTVMHHMDAEEVNAWRGAHIATVAVEED